MKNKKLHEFIELNAEGSGNMTDEKLDDCPLCKRTFMSKEIQDHVTSEMTKAQKDSNYMPKTFSESKKK